MFAKAQAQRTKTASRTGARDDTGLRPRRAFGPGPAGSTPWSFSRIAIQPKLTLSAVDDPLEHEADRVAARIMRMADDSAAPEEFAASDGVAIQRAADTDEIRERLINAFLNAGDETVQRQAAAPENEDDEEKGEEILMRKPSTSKDAEPGAAGLESRIRSLEGGGDALPDSVRRSMEPRFGHDFSGVRIHTGAAATELAANTNARAFTVGNNVVFASGQYAPHTTDGDLLLAHELTHVVQQGKAGRSVQRKIVVGGKPYTPSAKYYAYLTANFGPAMKEFVEHMHNSGNPPEYTFNTYEQMGFEVRTRANAIKGIEDVHKGCCDYYDNAHPPYLDARYWDSIGGFDFKLKSPLPGGKTAADAIEAIFAPGANTRLECLTMLRAIEHRAILKAVGAAKFNAMFAGGIIISVSNADTSVAAPHGKFKTIAVASKNEILPGDWVYFKNFKDYTARVPGGYWQGENALYLGNGMFRGFGVDPKSENDLNQELVNHYNNDAVPHLSKTVPDLIADGGGLWLNPVLRPEIANIAP